ILPRIDGLYKKDTNEYRVDGIFVSHPHMDHYDATRFLKDDFPIYCGATAKTIIVAREFSGQSIGAGYEIAKLTQRQGEEIFKNFDTFRTNDVIKKIAPFEIVPIHVDHSIPGAYGSIVSTENGNIVYTGDFRMHGPKKEMTLEFIEKAKEAEPDALLIEGTHINESKLESEEEVKNKVRKIVEKTKNLVLTGFAIADVDRIRTFYEVAKNSDRKFAVSTKQAFMIDMLSTDENLELFNLNDPNILIFKREKKRLRAYENYLEDKYDNIVDAKEINTIQKEVILVASLFDMNEMAEIKPDIGSTYILSSSEPYDEEMEISYDKLLNWLDHLGMPLYQVHASGHATPHELKEAISEISPKKVFPIHTNSPELFKRFISDIGVEMVLPIEGFKYEI
ncbi:MAG: MBL fold metallo-hydrolase, partial [Candidatus Hydrothermarchaeales archaeon]